MKQSARKGSTRLGDARVGISGWRYEPWRGTFYLPGLAQRRELEYASRKLNSIEINGSFYSLQRPESYRQWYEETPDEFVFSVKGGRYITHMLKLRDCETAVANFFASGVLCLREKLGPFLWQFPPQMTFNAEKLETFLKMLPRDTRAAADFAKGHNEKLKGRAYTKADVDLPVRHAVEVRHHSFEKPEFVDILRRHHVALVFADTAGKWPYGEDLTSDFVYCRLHGDEEIYVSGYNDPALDWWAARLQAWRAGTEPPDAKHWAGGKPPKKTKARDVFVYFDNDVKVRAPFDAMNLYRRLTGKPLDADGDAAPDAMDVAETARTQWPPIRRAPARRAAPARARKVPAKDRWGRPLRSQSAATGPTMRP